MENLFQQQEGDLETIQIVIIVCCALHNYCIAYEIFVEESLLEDQAVHSAVEAIGRYEPPINHLAHNYLMDGVDYC